MYFCNDDVAGRSQTDPTFGDSLGSQFKMGYLTKQREVEQLPSPSTYLGWETIEQHAGSSCRNNATLDCSNIFDVVSVNRNIRIVVTVTKGPCSKKEKTMQAKQPRA
eukprot:1161167-Pelagomonas_calceolata.AAC.4